MVYFYKEDWGLHLFLEINKGTDKPEVWLKDKSSKLRVMLKIIKC